MEKQRQLTYEDVLEIVEVIKSSAQFTQFHLKVGDIEVSLRRQGAGGQSANPPPAPAEAPAAQASVAPRVAAPPPVASPRAPGPRADSWPEGSVVIRSPMVGTFYRSPQPGAPPFVEVGQQVAAGTVVCIIEVMKLMNSIAAGAGGVVSHILVEDAAPVEYGQPLVVLAPG